MEEFLDNIDGIVEANNFETLFLYEKYMEDWKQINSGTFVTVGHVNGLPVCLSLLVNYVKGKKILFIEPTSRMVDWTLIGQWREDNFKGVKSTDAMNFHNLLK